MVEINRRKLLIGGGAAAAGVAAAGIGGFELLRKPSPGDSARRGGSKPNILVVVLDQLRAPQWFPEQQSLDALLPNMARLRTASVSFESHYTASNMCTPSRGALTTGLYSHQTGCLYTVGSAKPPTPADPGTGAKESAGGESVLSPGFPTWGGMLRELGYRTWWWGKWHLGEAGDSTPEGLEAYGFSGGSFPSPNGGLGQGLERDPGIADQFAEWFAAEAGNGPWCTTVSLVNPHDIAWWPRWPSPPQTPVRFHAAPANFETPEQLAQRRKPTIQRDMVSFFDSVLTGKMPTAGEAAQQQWARKLDVYLWLQQQADAHVGRVLDTLASRPDIDQNTVVVFTSDHGEYAGSHGLSGKGGAAYEEAIRVPLYIRDPKGQLTPTPGDTRSQLTSSVDFAPLLLTVAAGGPAWRADPRFAHLRARADIAAIAHDPAAKGRAWVAHATDDLFVEEFAAAVHPSGPEHLVAVRTADAKLGVYSSWREHSLDIDPEAPQEQEFYDYAADPGRQELDNQAGQNNPREAALRALYEHEVLAEVSAALPSHLAHAHEKGMDNMRAMQTARKETVRSMTARDTAPKGGG